VWFQTWVGASSPTEALASIFIGEAGYPIRTVQIASGVITISTREPHKILSGDTVTIQGAAIGEESSINIAGVYVVSTVTDHGLTVPTTLPNVAESYPDFATVFPRRPIITLDESDEGMHASSVGTGGANTPGGSIDILLEADVNALYINDPRNARTEARNAAGSFVRYLMATQETGDFMLLRTIHTIIGPEFTSDTEQDSAGGKRFERWRAIYRVTWGLE
jgi:hypothetical protein